jgi:hypothetical protein
MTDPGSPRNSAQTDLLDSTLTEEVISGVDKAASKIAMMISEDFRHLRGLSILTL